jgi:hypothetical protein
MMMMMMMMIVDSPHNSCTSEVDFINLSFQNIHLEQENITEIEQTSQYYCTVVTN